MLQSADGFRPELGKFAVTSLVYMFPNLLYLWARQSGNYLLGADDGAECINRMAVLAMAASFIVTQCADGDFFMLLQRMLHRFQVRIVHGILHHCSWLCT